MLSLFAYLSSALSAIAALVAIKGKNTEYVYNTDSDEPVREEKLTKKGKLSIAFAIFAFVLAIATQRFKDVEDRKASEVRNKTLATQLELSNKAISEIKRSRSLIAESTLYIEIEFERGKDTMIQNLYKLGKPTGDGIYKFEQRVTLEFDNPGNGDNAYRLSSNFDATEAEVKENYMSVAARYANSPYTDQISVQDFAGKKFSITFTEKLPLKGVAKISVRVERPGSILLGEAAGPCKSSNEDMHSSFEGMWSSTAEGVFEKELGPYPS